MTKWFLQRDLNDPTKKKIEIRTDPDEFTIAEIPEDLRGEDIEWLDVGDDGKVKVDPAKRQAAKEARKQAQEAIEAEKRQIELNEAIRKAAIESLASDIARIADPSIKAVLQKINIIISKWK